MQLRHTMIIEITVVSYEYKLTIAPLFRSTRYILHDIRGYCLCHNFMRETRKNYS